MSCLQLLQTCRNELDENNEAKEAIDLLEELLIDHSIEPFRTSNLERTIPNSVQDDSSLKNFSEIITSALRRFHFPQPKIGASKTRSHLTATFLSLLFDVAIRARPRNTSKQRMLEDPWLEKLFFEIEKCAADVLHPSSTISAQKGYARLLKWMLDKSVYHNLRLSNQSIANVMDRASGLVRDDQNHKWKDGPVEWGLISLCILNNANTFVIPSNPTNSVKSDTPRSPNKYLASLLARITTTGCPAHTGKRQNYDFITDHIVIPLCDAFVGARDLTDFFGHWKQQLIICQKRQDSQGQSTPHLFSLWEDERLLQHVAKLVEKALTASQIERILSAAAGDLKFSIKNGSDKKRKSLASLVILDCISAGSTREETLTTSHDIAHSTFDLLESHSLEFKTPSWLSNRWRIWRIKGAIADRWHSLHDSEVFQSQVISAISQASELIARIHSEPLLRHEENLSETLHAFAFITRFASMQNFFRQAGKFSLRQEFELAVGKLVDLIEPFCHSVSHDHFQKMQQPKNHPGWNSLNGRVKSIEPFYIGCVAYLLSSTNVFR